MRILRKQSAAHSKTKDTRNAKRESKKRTSCRLSQDTSPAALLQHLPRDCTRAPWSRTAPHWISDHTPRACPACASLVSFHPIPIVLLQTHHDRPAVLQDEEYALCIQAVLIETGMNEREAARTVNGALKAGHGKAKGRTGTRVGEQGRRSRSRLFEPTVELEVAFASGRATELIFQSLLLALSTKRFTMLREPLAVDSVQLLAQSQTAKSSSTV